MLAETENALIALVRQAPIGQRLREVASLPDLEGESLIGRFATDAPAVYVALGSFPVANRAARLKFGLACVARNSRSHEAARQGDGKAIGLYEIIEAVMALMDGARTPDANWRVTSCDLMVDDNLYKKGIYAGVVQIEMTGEVELPDPIDEDSLSPFETFHADLDIPPIEAAGEHAKWLQEPPDQTTSKPDAEDIVTLEQ